MATVRGIRGTSTGRAKRFAALIVAALAPVTAAACTGSVPSGPGDDAQLAQGRVIYANNCASCHGAAGAGGLGTKLNGGRVVQRFPDPADEKAEVANGRGQMPAFGQKLSSDQVDAVVRYTREVIATQ
jgi:mono/diheme cytochrome c family protein